VTVIEYKRRKIIDIVNKKEDKDYKEILKKRLKE
jgi:hypothetical protein